MSDAKLDVKALVVLVKLPAVKAWTGTTISQVLAAEIVPPASSRSVVLDTPVNVPLQVFVIAGVAATTKPVGKVLVKATAVTSIEPALLSMAKVNKDVSPWFIDAGANTCVQVNGRSTDVNVSVTAAVSDAKSEVNALEVLVNVPDSTARTGISISQRSPAKIDPASSSSACVPATAVNVPLQVLTDAGVLATSRPAGKVLVKATVPTSIDPAVLSIAKVKIDV